MQRVPRRRLLAAILASLTLMAVAIPPIAGVASAASTSTTCPSGDGTNCYLGISAPQSVMTGVPFTVTVGVYTDSDRTTLAKSDPCGSKAPVTLDVIRGESTVNSYNATASAAIATFSVTVSPDDMYTLRASAAFPESSSCSGYNFVQDFAELVAVTIPADQPIAPCPDNVTCVQKVSGGGTAATLIADSGSFFPVAFEGFVSTDGCGDGGPADTNGVLDFTYSGPDVKTIVLALSHDLVNRISHGIGLYNICWHSDVAFTPLGGGTLVFTGYLPNCKRGDSGPCVLFRKSNQYNVAFLGILAPNIDPKTYPK